MKVNYYIKLTELKYQEKVLRNKSSITNFSIVN